MAHIAKRAHASATGTPTGYWEPARTAPYGNMGMGICEGEENCDYWDHYYQQHNSHVLGMFITWGFIAGMVLLAAAINFSRRSRKFPKPQPTKDEEITAARSGIGGLGQKFRGLGAFFRHYFLPQSTFGLFPHVTRLQGTLVLLITLYCILFTFIGLSYGEWVNPTTPPGRRIGFLEFGGDRTGCLAFAFVPLVFILSSRDNLFSLITGISYQHFNFLHRWVGRFIFIMTWVHTILWSIELGIMYQPQPTKYTTTWAKRYWKWGVGATALLTFLFLHSFRTVQRWTGYEFFRKSHEFIAVLFLGACWGHWPEMREWMIAGIAIVFFDRFVRYFRLFLIHMNWVSSDSNPFGFHSFDGTISRYQDVDGVDVLILRVPTNVFWRAGQHYFLTFPSLNFFESHPYTVSNIPSGQGKKNTQLYVIRALSGQTKRLAKLCIDPRTEYPLPTLLCGAYGTPIFDPTAENIQLIAGGTGVSFTLPLAQELVLFQNRRIQKIDFVWIIRHHENLSWIQQELLELKSTAAELKIELSVRIFITRANSYGKSPSDENFISSKEIEIQPPKKTETGNLKGLDADTLKAELSVGIQSSVTEKFVQKAGYDTIEWYKGHHPDAKEIVTEFRNFCVGSLQVLASGPPELGRDLREAVAACNDSTKVWRGDGSGEVGMYWDCREY